MFIRALAITAIQDFEDDLGFVNYALENERTDNGLRSARGEQGRLVAGARTRFADSASVFLEERYQNGDDVSGLTHSTGITYAPTLVVYNGRSHYGDEKVFRDFEAATGVTLEEVVRAAEGSNQNASGGVYMDKGQEYVIRGIGRVQGTGDIANSVVAVRGGMPITIGQVADVVVGPAPRFGDGSIDGDPGVVLAVQKQPGANTLELTRRIEAELRAIQPTLPPEMTIRSELFRQSEFISLAVSNVMKALRDGAILVVVILFLFLWNLRATGISIVAIPLSLVVAIFAMQLLGISINTMTLGGMAIAIGALVDDAIIDVENVFRRLKENHHLPEGRRQPVLRVTYDASREIRASIVNATLIIIVVFLPLFFLGGVEGRLLRPLGLAYVVSILASLLVAVTVTPVLCLLLLPRTAALEFFPTAMSALRCSGVNESAMAPGPFTRRT